MIATKVMVKAFNNWPDYVFAKTHKLKTLPEIEKYIKQYGHLEDVPTQAQVKEKGIDVGEMNTILLEKVEELTLFMIDQNKTIQELKSQVSELKKVNR
jgi:hypothetical protein